MNRVTVVGAGELGAGIVARLAGHGWPGEVLLLGRDAGPAAGKALDVQQSNPVLGSPSSVRGVRETAETAGSACVIAAGPRASSGDDDLPMPVERLAELLSTASPEATLIAAGSAPELLMEPLRRAGVAPERMLGCAPEALAAAWRRQLGDALGCSSSSVSVSIVGAPPRTGLYEAFGAVAGVAVEELLGPADLRSVRRRASTDAGPRALAAAAVGVLEDMVRRSGAIRSCYAWSGGAYGARGVFLAAPVILGRRGVERVLELRLDPARGVTVARAIDHLAAGR